ncbi:MAG: hypothetical protein WC683_05035 [bacterium]
MVVSTIAGGLQGGSEYTCILYEGAPTVTAKTLGPDGYYDTGIVPASPLQKDDIVVLDIQSENTYEATGGLPVVKAVTNGTLILGKILTEPKTIGTAPTTAAGDTWAKILAGKYYRIAKVKFFGVTDIEKAILVGASTANIVPGVPDTLKVDVSGTVAVSGGVVTLSCADAANGGSGIFSFHYVANGAVTVSILAGFTGGPVVIQG